ncbi:MAG: NUDIX hydrolase [Paracoccaceae bacterium]|nr:NUDIX hydrolase [Paracoccaceae bacterium]
MTELFSRIVSDVLSPFVRRPKRYQVAALCFREKSPGRKEVLLITSRDTGRWILPKGWPINGFDAPGTALQEAWEEAGVKGAAPDPEPIGSYEYEKMLDGGLPVTCHTDVYRVKVAKLAEDYPEISERRREWMTPQRAAELVNEPGLKDLLRHFS